jgi:DNA repair photolyase
MRVVFVERRSPVLSPSSLACLAHTPAVNLTCGCAHNCIYCYARGYSSYPGHETIFVYKNTLDKIKNELLAKKTKPRYVYFSPSSDIFQPIPEVLDLAYAVFGFLLSKGIGVAFLTKGYIPDKIMALLLHHADRVRAQIGIITPDDYIRRVFEPGATNTDMRLQQMKKLADGGIAVEARLMPILPGITDSKDSLNHLFASIAATGVNKTAVSSLFLRPSIIKSLLMCLPDRRTAQSLLGLYRNSVPIAVHADRSSVTPLPRPVREEIYDRVNCIAQKYAVKTSICGCMNPDIGGSCNIGGDWPVFLPEAIQPDLFASGVGLY